MTGTCLPCPQESWLDDSRYLALLRQTRTIAFGFDTATGEQFYTPFIRDYLAGNFDGRSLPEIFLDDGVVHPADRNRLSAFCREAETAGGGRRLVARLRTREGTFRWHRIATSTHIGADGGSTVLGTIIDVDEETRLREELRYRAEYDSVTGIYNNMTFFRETRRLLERRPESAFHLLRFDIERFKAINELFSNGEGDRVLRYTGDVLRRVTRQGETFGRLRDDVFAVCLDRPRPEIPAFVESLGARLNDYPLDFQFILSCGVLPVERYTGEPVNILCDRAALAQRTVKGNYVRRIAFYEPRMGDALSREHWIMGGMRQALEDDQFVLFFQPKFDMRTNRPFGAEALVRWNHPTAGMIPPGDFIPLFERNGFIIPLDEYVWDLACKTLRGWLDRGLQPLPVSVNVSRVHLHDPDLAQKIRAIARRHGIEPRLLELEITESAYVDNARSLCAAMDQLKQMGFTFSMDDFGSGYSSLNMLGDIPVDVLKLDLNFLRGTSRGLEVGRTIMETAIHMAGRLGMPVIAEGVETQDQAGLLLEAGCVLAQGYLFGHPMPAEEFERAVLGAYAGPGPQGTAIPGPAADPPAPPPRAAASRRTQTS